MKVIASDRRLSLNDELSPRSRRVNVSGILGSNGASDGSTTELLAKRSWYCLRCRRNEEMRTASHLRASSGVEVFCPRIRFAQVNRKKRMWVSEPLFPGYFFAKLGPRMLAQTCGVYDVVKLGDQCAVASDELIKKLKDQARATETGDPRSAFAAGEQWKGLDDIGDSPEIIILQILAGSERIERLLNFFQQPATAQLGDDNLFPSIAGGFELLKFAARIRVLPPRRRVGRGSQGDMKAFNGTLDHLHPMLTK